MPKWTTSIRSNQTALISRDFVNGSKLMRKTFIMSFAATKLKQNKKKTCSDSGPLDEPSKKQNKKEILKDFSLSLSLTLTLSTSR